MEIFYKGNLALTEHYEFKKIDVKDTINGINYYGELTLDTAPQKAAYKNYYNNEVITDKEILDEIDEILKTRERQKIASIRCHPYIGIIFEIKIDDKGNKYAKEILTGEYFPLTYEKEVEFYKIDRLTVGANISFNQNQLQKVGCIVAEYKVADKNEVEAYKKKHKKGFKKDYWSSVNLRFKKTLETLANKNVYINDISFVSEETLEKQNKITKVMENIEYLLFTLKSRDNSLYNEYNEEYQKLINQSTLEITKISLDDLTNLESKIKLDLKTAKRNGKDINGYLNSIISDYIIHFMTSNDNEIDIQLEELNRINGLFLKVKEQYFLQDQRSIIRKLSLAYLMVVKGNYNDINIDDLEKSYFKDNIKSILLAIKVLMEEDIIKADPAIDLIENITISNVLEIIGNIKFNKANIEEAKSLVKNFSS